MTLLYQRWNEIVRRKKERVLFRIRNIIWFSVLHTKYRLLSRLYPTFWTPLEHFWMIVDTRRRGIGGVIASGGCAVRDSLQNERWWHESGTAHWGKKRSSTMKRCFPMLAAHAMLWAASICTAVYTRRLEGHCEVPLVQWLFKGARYLYSGCPVQEDCRLTTAISACYSRIYR